MPAFALLTLSPVGMPPLLASDTLTFDSADASGCWPHCRRCLRAQHLSSTLWQSWHLSRCAGPGGTESCLASDSTVRQSPSCGLVFATALKADSARSPQPSPDVTAASVPAASSFKDSSADCMLARQTSLKANEPPLSSIPAGLCVSAGSWNGTSTRCCVAAVLH
jgi:hypothetical protein